MGLGYVGLPVACAFAKKMARVIGFDINPGRIESLRKGLDWTGEVATRDLQRRNLEFTTDPSLLRDCRAMIITVPTPVDERNEPDLTPVRRAAEIVGKNLSRGALVILESTVYPGVTEDILLPILERESGMKLDDFFIGYSPERINPGDKQHTLDKITKVVSGNNAKALERVTKLYSLVAPAVHRAPNIKTAEAAKVIENIQRDLNIALMNELSLIFQCLGLNTHEVLTAAATKWNFQRFHPGLVGGHCIGVDPYYLTHRAKELGYHPAVILAGRAINDAMARHVAEMLVTALKNAGKDLKSCRVLLLGLTFKENVPDIRNSKIADTIKTLRDRGVTVLGCDPFLSPETIQRNFGIAAVSLEQIRNPKRETRNKFKTPTLQHTNTRSLLSFDAVALVNAHRAFSRLTLAQLRRVMNRTPILLDLKNFFGVTRAASCGFIYQSL